MTSPTSTPISPDTITTKQVVGAFTAKHWAATIGVIFTAFSAVAGGSFWVGQQIAESKAEVRVANAAIERADLQSQVGETKADLKVSSARISQLLEKKLSLQSAHRASQAELERQRQEIVSLSTALGKASNCTFIHDQIRAINVQLQSTGSLILFSNSEESKQKESERKASLQSQMSEYQQQLGNCNK